MPCGAVPCFLSNTQLYQVLCDTRYRLISMYMCTRIFSLSSFDCPLSVLLFCFRKSHPYWRSERGIAIKHTINSTAQGNQLCVKSSSWRYRMADEQNYGPLLSAAFTFSCNLPCASDAGGISRPQSGALVLKLAWKANIMEASSGLSGDRICV